MRKIILLMAISALTFVSCSKEEAGSKSSTSEVSVSSVSSSITSYVNENYPDAEISTIQKSTSGSRYYVTLDTYEQITFDGKGNVINEGDLALLSDSTDTHHHHHHHGHHGHEVDVDSLPSAVSDYVSLYYSGYTIHNAQYDSLCQFGKVLNVIIDSSKTTHHKLIFDTAGSYLALAHRVDSTSIPAAVISTLSSSYSTYTLRKRAERLTLEDASLQYRIFLHQDSTKLCVAMYENGTVICEQ